MFLLCCLHLTFSHLQFHNNNLLHVFILFCLHIFYFGFVSDFHFLEFLFQVWYLSFQHVNLTLFLSDSIVMFFKVFLLLMFLFGLKWLKRWDSNECSFFSFSFKGVIDHLYFTIFLFVFFLELSDLIFESFIVLF